MCPPSNPPSTSVFIPPMRSHSSPSSGFTFHDALLSRIFAYSRAEKMRETIAAGNVKPDEGDEWLRIGGMKTLVDGGFEGGHMRTAYEEPFGKGGKYKGIQVVPLADYVAAVRELNRLGWRVATHAVGDAAIDQVLDAYAAADR